MQKTKQIYIKRDRRYWNTCGWSPYKRNARVFRTDGEAEQFAREMAATGVACGIVKE